MKSTTPPLATYKHLFAELFAKQVTFVLEEEFEEALQESVVFFHNLEEGEKYEFDPEQEFLFLAWFLLDDTDAENHSLLDLFLERYADSLSIQEKQICHAMRETHLSLLELKEIVPGQGMILKDMFLGEEFEVSETLGSQGTLPAGSLLFTRVLKLGDSRFLVGAGLFLNSLVAEPLTRFVSHAYQETCEEEGAMSFKEFLKDNGELINHWIRAYEKGDILSYEPEDDPDDDSDSGPDGGGKVGG